MPPKFYPLSKEEFSLSVFKSPPADYRGAPLWSWNNKLRKEQLLYQVGAMKEMGFGGYHIHVRAGMDTEYLGEEYFELVRATIEEGKSKNMLTYLYDEDRWPSGGCGGQIVKENPEFRQRHLLMTRYKYGDKDAPPVPAVSPIGPVRTENGTLLGEYTVKIDADGYLESYTAGDGEGEKWYAYLEYDMPSVLFNDSVNVDTLNKAAIDRFIEKTHEKYLEQVGDEFGKTIKSIFTDEPQFSHKSSFATSDSTSEAFLPWTPDLEDTFRAEYGYSLLEKLPELFWDKRGVSKARYHYHDHVCERFNVAFVDNISEWCGKHGISLIGHMMYEDNLLLQTEALGEAMRSYRAFPLPGIDMLQDGRQTHAVKQAQSVSHQYGREGVMCEAYGVTDWDFTFAGHKSQGDWLAVLGVTLRVHHLTWVSMRGEAKRDYPACLGYQSPWYKEYSLVEDYYSRLNTALTRGKPVVRIGVIHPIENYWLAFGPWQTSKEERTELSENFDNLCDWLLYGHLDFDYISESLLPGLVKDVSCPLQVGAMAYEAIVVPSARNLRRTTYDILLKYASLGGKVIFMGDTPTYVDVDPAPELIQTLVSKSVTVPFTKRAIRKALKPLSEVQIDYVDGKDPDSPLYVPLKETILYTMREEEDGSRFVFFCNTSEAQQRPNTIIKLRGQWDITGLDAFSGESFEIPRTVNQANTVFYHTFPRLGSLLVRLQPTTVKKNDAAVISPRKEQSQLILTEPVSFKLDDPNVLLLDRALFKAEGSEWSEEPEEIRRLDNVLRQQIGIPIQGIAVPQPFNYTDKKALPSKRVYLQLEFDSDITTEAHLATEHASSENFSFDPQLEVKLDGEPVETAVDGWFVDWDISTIKLPTISPGHHVLEYSIVLNEVVSLEWLYLLGDFGVELRGKFAKIVPLPKTLAIGDWVPQGLPFYGGNVTYNFPVDQLKVPEGSKHLLRVAEFKGPVVEVSVDSKRIGLIAFDPYELEVPLKGAKLLQIKVYGDRENTFGALHRNNLPFKWCGPGAWYGQGDYWTYLYRLGAKGIVNHPQIIAIS